MVDARERPRWCCDVAATDANAGAAGACSRSAPQHAFAALARGTEPAVWGALMHESSQACRMGRADARIKPSLPHRARRCTNQAKPAAWSVLMRDAGHVQQRGAVGIGRDLI